MPVGLGRLQMLKQRCTLVPACPRWLAHSLGFELVDEQVLNIAPLYLDVAAPWPARCQGGRETGHRAPTAPMWHLARLQRAHLLLHQSLLYAPGQCILTVLVLLRRVPQRGRAASPGSLPVPVPGVPEACAW